MSNPRLALSRRVAVPVLLTAAAAAAAAVPSMDREEETDDPPIKLDQTELEMFPEVIDQKNTFWDTITTDQLVWYQNFPAIVVPEHLLFSLPHPIKEDCVMAYGPSSVNVKPAEKRE